MLADSDRGHNMTRRSRLVAGLALVLGALLGYLDLHSTEVLLPMLSLLSFSFVLGFLQPKTAWLWGIIMGLSLPATYGVASAVHYTAADAPGRPITLVVLVVPALVAAYVGALAHRMNASAD